MLPDFVNREHLRRQLFLHFKNRATDKKLLLLESPAGMGKTYAVIQVCMDLVGDAWQVPGQPWKFIWLDFRKSNFVNQADILAEIARQFCSDELWTSLRQEIRSQTFSDSQNQERLRQAATMPLPIPTRETLLRITMNLSPPDLESIRPVLQDAFDNVDIRNLLNSPQFRDSRTQVAATIRFIAERKQSATAIQIPDNVILVLDSLDAINDPLREWVLNEMSPALQSGLSNHIRHFFVMVIGRFISQHLNQDIRPRYYGEFSKWLEPFKLEYIEDLIKSFGDNDFNTNEQKLRGFARKLESECSGHPRILKEIAEILFKEPGHFSGLVHDPNDAMYWYVNPLLGIQDQLKEKHQQTIEEITGRLEAEEKEALRLLSVFRHFNRATLEYLLSRVANQHNDRTSPEWPRFTRSAEDLFQRLEEKCVIGEAPEEGFLSGYIGTRLIAAQMKRDEPQRFRILHGWAMELFADWMAGRFPDDPQNLRPQAGPYQRVCLCDWLFHFLCENLPQPSEQSPLSRNRPSDTGEADIGETAADELEKLLDLVVFYPGIPRNKTMEQIKKQIEGDNQIDHLIWEIAGGDEGHYQNIRNRIVKCFNIYLRENKA